MSRRGRKLFGIIAVIGFVLTCLSSIVEAGCDSGRSVQNSIGPSELLMKLRANAEATGSSPFFKQGTFDEEELRYLGRTPAPGAFDLVLLTTTWGEACRATRRLLVFDYSGMYLGCYTGLSAAPTQLVGSALLFPVEPELGDRIEFNAQQPVSKVRLDGYRLSFETARRIP